MGSEEPAVLKHLAQLEEQRKLERERKRAESKLEADPRESGEDFLAYFNKRIAELKDQLSAVSSAGEPVVDDVRKSLEAILLDIVEVDARVSNASYFLPKYDVKQSRETIQNLRNKVESAKEQLVPKKKFAFSKRSKQTTTARKAPQEAPKNDQEPAVAVDADIAPPRGLNHLSGKQLNITEDELGSNEYSLIDLEDCTIFLLGKFSALHIRKLHKCVVVAGPVTGSVLIEDVSECQFHLACHQARIHSAKDVSFSLRVCSNPIIEHSTRIQFAPLCSKTLPEWTVKIQETFQDSGSELWSKVNDFGWLKTTPSPNWSVIPSDEYPEVPTPSAVDAR